MQKRFFYLALAFYALFTPVLSYCQQTIGLFTKNAGEQDGYIMFYPNSSKNCYLMDKCGKLVHQWNTNYVPGLDDYILPNGNLLSTGRLSDPYFNSAGAYGGLLQILDWNGKLLWDYVISDSIEKQDHDVYPMANGNILVCEWERITNREAIAAGRDSAKLKKSNIWSVKVQEIKPIGMDSALVVWQWRLWDHLVQDHDSSKPGYGVVSGHPELLNVNYVDSTETNSVLGDSDWIHANAVSYNADLEQVMISSRSLSEIWIVDHSTTTAEAASHSGGNHGKGGDFLYRWGNPAAYNSASIGHRTLFLQHDASWIPDGLPGAGNITVFNNGVNRPGGNYSSADEFAPPVDANGNYYLATSATYGPDSSFWSYKASKPKNMYSSTEGSVQRLPNGNTLVCEADSGIFLEVDSFKNLLWKYVNPVGNAGTYAQGKVPVVNTSFRCQWYSINYPGLNGHSLEPGSPIEKNPYSYDCFMPYKLYNKPIYKIAEVKGNNSSTGIADSIDTYCYLKGTVQSGNLSGNNSQYFSLQDSTGAIAIITASSINGYRPIIGDSILVRGVVLQTNGLTYFDADSIIKLTMSNQIAPKIINSLIESNESQLVTLKRYSLIDSTKWDTTSANGSFDVLAQNGEDTIILKIVRGTNLYSNEQKPSGIFNVTGIEGQEDSAIPYFANYYLIPRSISDFSASSGIMPIYPFAGQIEIYPNPTSNSLQITSSIEINALQITDVVGSILISKSDINSKTTATDLNAYKAGIYFVKVFTYAGSKTIKIVKE